MADKGTPDDGPSLEMPSFSLRRTRSPRSEPTAAAAPEPTQGTVPGDPHPDAAPAATQVLRTESAPFPAPAPARRATRERRKVSAPSVRLPALPGLHAAAVTGVVVGALAVLLTWLAVSSCDVVRGTKSCGGGPGFLILVAVLLILAYAGGWLLQRFGVPDAGSTSFLAVGVTAVLVMLFLLDAIYDWWMVIAIPVVSVVAYLGSWWVTASVMDPDDGSESVSPR